jgi:hypothetical protein
MHRDSWNEKSFRPKKRLDAKRRPTSANAREQKHVSFVYEKAARMVYVRELDILILFPLNDFGQYLHYSDSPEIVAYRRP